MTTYTLTKETWLSPDEVARILGLSYHQLNRLLNSRRLRVTRLPSGHRRICRQDVEELLRRGLLVPPRHEARDKDKQ